MMASHHRNITRSAWDKTHIVASATHEMNRSTPYKARSKTARNRVNRLLREFSRTKRMPVYMVERIYALQIIAAASDKRRYRIRLRQLKQERREIIAHNRNPQLAEVA